MLLTILMKTLQLHHKIWLNNSVWVQKSINTVFTGFACVAPLNLARITIMYSWYGAIHTYACIRSGGRRRCAAAIIQYKWFQFRLISIFSYLAYTYIPNSPVADARQFNTCFLDTPLTDKTINFVHSVVFMQP